MLDVFLRLLQPIYTYVFCLGTRFCQQKQLCSEDELFLLRSPYEFIMIQKKSRKKSLLSSGVLKLFLLLETKQIEVDSIDVYYLPDFCFYLSHLTQRLFPHLSFNIKVSCLLFSPDKTSYASIPFPSVFLSISLVSAIILSFPSPSPLLISVRFVTLFAEAIAGLCS